jgi:hypothetical protein
MLPAHAETVVTLELGSATTTAFTNSSQLGNPAKGDPVEPSARDAKKEVEPPGAGKEYASRTELTEAVTPP